MSNARKKYARMVIQRRHEILRKTRGRAEHKLTMPRQPAYRTPGHSEGRHHRRWCGWALCGLIIDSPADPRIT